MPSEKLLLTGATGCLGRSVVESLLTHDAVELVATARVIHHALPVHPRLRWVSCDLRDSAETRRLLVREKPGSVLHLAATGVRPPRPSANELHAVNVDVSLRLFA